MLEPSEITRAQERHEEVFLARYASLRAWALRLTGGDAPRAEDLVHDAFVQFTLTRPELGRVENLDGYLYTMLRNLNTSQLRRARRRREDAPSVVEYDSADFVLRSADPRDLIRVQDDLRQVYRYASLRKETSKAGSVLILRFMHGYYPAEIALVMRSTREAVEERLRVARSEAKQFLKDPASLRFIERDRAHAAQPATGFAQTPEELLADLRRGIFDSRRGECLSADALARLYREGPKGAPDCSTLAHLVSCPRCIDEVNDMHGLPKLAERCPTDALGADTRRRGDGGGGDDSDGPGDGGGTASGGATEEEARRCRRRARDVFEHRPRELCVSVNGRQLAAQKVGAVLNEQKLNVGAEEEVSFVEVFSEQDVRLLYLDPSVWTLGGGDCSVRVELSDRRTLEARLSYVDSAPTLQVVYRDPLMAESPAAQHERDDETALSDDAAREAAPHGLRPRAAAWEWVRKISARAARPFAALRPGAVAAGLAVLVVAALLFTRFSVKPVSAAELLRRAAAAEETAAAGGANLVLHRTVFVEEAKAGGRGPVSRRRVETWQGGASGIRLRRLYDEQGKLVAGEWTNSDGASALYRRGAPPSEAAAVGARALLEAGEVWRIEPSAKNFNALGAPADRMKVEDRLGAYVVGYEDSAAPGALLSASLWLNKADLRAYRMTLVVRREGGEATEYRLIEGGLEKKRADEVPPSVYQLESELLDAARGADDESGRARTQGDDARTASSVARETGAVASAELEVEVAYLLNRIKANLGEQVSMGRTARGGLRVEALVESDERKAAILNALGPVIGNPAVRVEVNTVAEALAKRQGAQGDARPSLPEREVSVTAGRIPADAELRAHFAARLADAARVDSEIKQYASRAMGRSRQALLHASALKRLVGRFTPAEARALDPEARSKWLSMIREHAAAYRREASALRTQLGSVFGGAGAGGDSGAASNPAQAAERLLRLSYAQDAAVRSAFTISEEGGTAAAIKSRQFWRDLAASERLASAIVEAYEQ